MIVGEVLFGTSGGGVSGEGLEKVSVMLAGADVDIPSLGVSDYVLVVIGLDRGACRGQEPVFYEFGDRLEAYGVFAPELRLDEGVASSSKFFISICPKADYYLAASCD